MARFSRMQFKEIKLESMSTTERVENGRVFAEAKLAADVGERVHDARGSAGLSQRELARRTGTSRAAIDRPESGGVGATLTTLQRVATALELEVNVELRPTA